MAGLNVVCLISGGKDSFFSILHCLANGHHVVALANLHPPFQEEGMLEDLDSYMYQTVGHTVIPLYEQALGLPLYRQEIIGGAVNKDKCYGHQTASQQDETEALVPLLTRVRSNHPEVNAVSTGAILSDYQRTRVESVALRLGLTPLSYLWQWPHLPPFLPASLLDDMSAVGQDSRIIKVASGGLDENLLWRNVADARASNRLVKAAQRFGTVDDGAALGEGGEYETLAVAGPAPLWKGKIVVDEGQYEVVMGEAGSASMKITGARVEFGGDIPSSLSSSFPELRKPPLLEEQFEAILRKIDDAPLDAAAVKGAGTEVGNTNRLTSRADNELLLSNVTGSGETAAEQMRSIMEQIRTGLKDAGHAVTDIIYTSIILRDMAEFPAMNVVYGSYFTAPNPPARITFASANVLPSGKHVTVSATSVRAGDTSPSKGLHVQSRSYWAPANIGPYSQAKTALLRDNDDVGAGELVYIAGQIPMIPASMDLPDPDVEAAIRAQSALDSSGASGSSPMVDSPRRLFSLQTVLSMQHFVRVGRVMGVHTWMPAIALIVASSADDAKWKANIAQYAWKEFHNPPANEDSNNDEEDVDSETFDVWDLKHGAARHFVPSQESSGLQHRFGAQMEVPRLFVVQVVALPRGASIEWVTYGSTGLETRPAETLHLRHLLEVFDSNIVA